MSKYVKVHFKGNWADEMDIEGFSVVEKELFETLYKNVSKIKGPIEVYYGTNESSEYRNINQYLKQFIVSDVSDEIAEILIKEVGNIGYNIMDELKAILEYEYENFTDENESDISYEDWLKTL